MPDGSENTVLDYRVGLMETAVKDIGAALGGIRETLNTLATLEVRHMETRDALTRAFAQISDCDKRLDAIEKALPLLLLTSKWVRGGVIAVVGIVGAAVLKLLLTTA